MKDKLLKIIQKYGIEHQQRKLQEEVFELQQAIIQYNWNSKMYDERVAKECVAEEISDIIVMLKQFQHYFNIKDEEIEKVMQFKVDRQLERMKNERNNI